MECMEDDNDSARCQYSYTAACSVECLLRKDWCRYGRIEAAVPFRSTINGSCCNINGIPTMPLELRLLGLVLQSSDKPTRFMSRPLRDLDAIRKSMLDLANEGILDSLIRQLLSLYVSHVNRALTPQQAFQLNEIALNYIPGKDGIYYPQTLKFRDLKLLVLYKVDVLRIFLLDILEGLMISKEVRNEEVGPSWSWISIQSAIRYWDDLDYAPQYGRSTCKLRNIYPGKVSNSLPGSLTSGILEIDGYLTPLVLEYRYINRSEEGVSLLNEQHHDIFHYTLRTRQRTAVHYSMDFYPDFPLSIGCRALLDGALVFLLHVTFNIYLVLSTDEKLTSEGTYTKEARSRLVQNVQFKRIGSFRLPAGVLTKLYKEQDWTAGIHIH